MATLAKILHLYTFHERKIAQLLLAILMRSQIMVVESSSGPVLQVSDIRWGGRCTRCSTVATRIRAFLVAIRMVRCPMSSLSHRHFPDLWQRFPTSNVTPRSMNHGLFIGEYSCQIVDIVISETQMVPLVVYKSRVDITKYMANTYTTVMST